MPTLDCRVLRDPGRGRASAGRDRPAGACARSRQQRLHHLDHDRTDTQTASQRKQLPRFGVGTLQVPAQRAKRQTAPHARAKAHEVDDRPLLGGDRDRLSRIDLLHFAPERERRGGGGTEADHPLWCPATHGHQVEVGGRRSIGDAEDAARQLGQLAAVPQPVQVLLRLALRPVDPAFDPRAKAPPQKAAHLALLCDGEGGNRTHDTTIFSRVLYQLSYLAWVRGAGLRGRKASARRVARLLGFRGGLGSCRNRARRARLRGRDRLLGGKLG